MLHFETERLILRDYRPEDFDAYYRLKSDGQTMYYLQDIQLHSIEEAQADFQAVLSDIEKDDRTYYFLHMELKDTHEQVGSIGYTVTDRTPVGKLVHLGYFTYPRFWGNGYVSEALNRLLRYAFTEDRVYRVSTGCLAENVGSERVMQKNGMVREAVHIDHEWHDGEMKTRLEYRLLRREYLRALKESPLFFNALPADLHRIDSFYRSVTAKTEHMAQCGRWIYGLHHTEEMIHDFVEEGFMYCLEDNGCIIAAAAVTPYQGNDYHRISWSVDAEDDEVSVVQILCTAPYKQHQGLARKLMHEITEISRLQNKKAIRLDTQCYNLPAQRLYESLGFVRCGTKNLYADNIGWTDFFLYEYPL